VSDGQLAALLGAIGSAGTILIATLRWAVNRITKALDDNSDAHRDNAREMAILSTKIDQVYQATERVRDFVAEERSGVHEAPPKVKRRTPPEGWPTGGLYAQHRRKTQNDSEDE
jgi:hypothetical protein